ncbi:tetrahydroberberine oxidase-like [Typha angustifolia]|uniref:tetrahydroberberine oxidase-like n=1 Tax=Typha angustifolia TaxID=59011 RepID=UPI003C2ACB41
MGRTMSYYLITLISIIFLSIFSHASPLISHTSYESFLQCLLHHSIPHNLLYTPNTTSYSTLLQSSIQNLRFNETSTPKPLVVVSPIVEGHVQATVKCSRSSRIQFRVRSGGHDYEGLSYVAYGVPFLVLDLQKMSSINIDSGRNTAWVQAGATLGELYYRIAEKNMTAGFPAGLCPTVGVGGHFSGGGIGTMIRKYGLAADNIIDAHLVNVNGEILDRKSMGENLFWAIRGGGGASFGVILAYKIKLVHVPPKVTVFNKSTYLSHGAPTKLIMKWQNIAYRMDERLFIRSINQISNDEKGNRTVQVSLQSLFLGEKEELLNITGESFPELALKAEDCQEMSWVESAKYFADYSNGVDLRILLARNHSNIFFKAKSDFLTQPIPELGWQRIWKELLKGEQYFAIMILDPFGGKMDEISESETPFPHRKGSLYNIQYLVGWLKEEAKGSKKHLNWMRRFYKFMTPYVSKNPRAAYLNYRDLDLGSSYNGHTSYSKAKVWGRRYYKNNFKRLALVKSEVDPGNFFRNEQSIPPLVQYW